MFPFPGESSKPRDWTQISCIAGRFLTIWAIRSLIKICKILWYTLYIIHIHCYLVTLIFALTSLGVILFSPSCRGGLGSAARIFQKVQDRLTIQPQSPLPFLNCLGTPSPPPAPTLLSLSLSSWQSFSHPCFFFFKEGRNICLLSRLCMACRSSWQREQVIS